MPAIAEAAGISTCGAGVLSLWFCELSLWCDVRCRLCSLLAETWVPVGWALRSTWDVFVTWAFVDCEVEGAFSWA